MKILKFLLGLLLLTTIAYFGFYPIALDPVARKAPPYPGLIGVYQPNTKLANTTLVPLPSAGPESIVLHPEGHFFTGLANGDIVRFNATGEEQNIIANTGGRPLGIKIAPNGNLIIARSSRNAKLEKSR